MASSLMPGHQPGTIGQGMATTAVTRSANSMAVSSAPACRWSAQQRRLPETQPIEYRDRVGAMENSTSSVVEPPCPGAKGDRDNPPEQERRQRFPGPQSTMSACSSTTGGPAEVVDLSRQATVMYRSAMAGCVTPVMSRRAFIREQGLTASAGGR
jgi:hypothetical protein